MMDRKTVSEIKAELEAHSSRPAGKPTTEEAIVIEKLEALCAALEAEAKKRRKPKTRRPVKH
jgi:hypothetical protein